MSKKYWVYIMTNKRNGTLYVGMTSDIENGLDKLVFLEEFPHPLEAIEAEKKIKGWLRIKKLNLIESKNPEWKNLSSLDSSLRSE